MDGHSFTFNGWGEYRPITMGDLFELQARTEPVDNSTATQFTACAMASPKNGTRVEVWMHLCLSS